jgi:protein-S-isoprenylcysteine O-methyltransferase Ste14
MKSQVPLPPPILMLVLLVGAGILQVIFPGLQPVPFHSVLAWIFLVAGCLVSLSGFITFKQNRTPVKPGAKPTQLVIGGPYRFTRNPMYLGMLLFSIGVLFALRSPWFLIPPIAYFLMINFWQIPFEETLLRERFGRTYDDYCQNVRRWL